MDQGNKQHPHQEQRQNEPTTTTSQGHQLNQVVPLLQFGATTRPPAPTGTLPPFALQPIAFTCKSEFSSSGATFPVQVIENPIEPILRDRIANLDKFKCHRKHVVRAQQDPTWPAQTNSNWNFLMDPLALLPQHSTTFTPAAAAGVMAPSIFSTHIEPTTKTVLSNQSKVSTQWFAQEAVEDKLKPVGVSQQAESDYRSSHLVSPYEFMKFVLASRGYRFVTVKSSKVGYMTDPSPLQLASFGTALISAVYTSDVQLLSSLLECGLSPNPCNPFRDCLLSWACRKSKESVFACFLAHHADIRVCDGFGRTPLHHAAWAGTLSSAIVASILLRDPIQLFLEDNAGLTPLEYVPPHLTAPWIVFLDQHKDELFPANAGPSPMAVMKRNDKQLADPPNALSIDLARLVSSGNVQPKQIAALEEVMRTTFKFSEDDKQRFAFRHQ